MWWDFKLIDFANSGSFYINNLSISNNIFIDQLNLFCIKNRALFKLTNSNNSASEIRKQQLFNLESFLYLKALTIDENDFNRIALIANSSPKDTDDFCYSKLFYSENSGLSWKTIEIKLNYYPKSLIFSKQNKAEIFIGTNNGLYKVKIY